MGAVLPRFNHLYNVEQEDIDSGQLFNDHDLRGRLQCRIVDKQRNRLNIRKQLFSQRVTDAWGQLPSTVVDATSINSFKKKLDEL